MKNMGMKRILTWALLGLMLVPAKAQTEWLNMQEKRHDWFLGGQITRNVAIADNITDHSTMKYLGSAMGMGADLYVGRFLSKVVAVRVGAGFQSVKNRGDNEWISKSSVEAGSTGTVKQADGTVVTKPMGFHDDIKGKGYYHYNVVNVNADAVFDFTNMGTRGEYRKFHVMGYAGLGVLIGGEKKYDEKREGAGKEHLQVMHIDDKATTNLAVRVGVIGNLNLTERFALNLDLGLSTTGDTFDGIDYDEPVDFLFKPSLGFTFCF